MAKPNYSFEKHRRELTKKKKKEEKTQRKLTKSQPVGAATVELSPQASAPVDADTSAGNT